MVVMSRPASFNLGSILLLKIFTGNIVAKENQAFSRVPEPRACPAGEATCPSD